MNNNYKIPLDFGRILNRERLPKCDLVESIKEFVHLIVITSPREYRRDPNFGCTVWDYEYEILPQENRFQTLIKEAVLDAIQRFEPRLEDVQIDLISGYSVGQAKKLDIQVTGLVKETAERFHFRETVTLCPKAAD